MSRRFATAVIVAVPLLYAVFVVLLVAVAVPAEEGSQPLIGFNYRAHDVSFGAFILVLITALAGLVLWLLRRSRSVGPWTIVRFIAVFMAISAYAALRLVWAPAMSELSDVERFGLGPLRVWSFWAVVAPILLVPVHLVGESIRVIVRGLKPV